MNKCCAKGPSVIVLIREDQKTNHMQMSLQIFSYSRNLIELVDQRSCANTLHLWTSFDLSSQDENGKKQNKQNTRMRHSFYLAWQNFRLNFGATRSFLFSSILNQVKVIFLECAQKPPNQNFGAKVMQIYTWPINVLLFLL